MRAGLSLRWRLQRSGLSTRRTMSSDCPDLTQAAKKRPGENETEDLETHGTGVETHINALKRPKQANEKFKSTRSDKETTAKIEKAFSETFGPLKLEEIGFGNGKSRPRNHVNPLSSKYQVPVAAPKWEDVYQDANLPLWIDIGCAQGRFGIQMALSERWKNQNHLGLEIRQAHVDRANTWASEKQLKNLHYIFCNANTSLENFLSSYPGPVSHIAVQFPDPQFKRKYHKRRVVNEEFLGMLSKNTKEGTVLFFQSDVEEAAAQMRDRTDTCKYFNRVGDYSPRDQNLDPAVCATGSDDSVWTKDGKRPKENDTDPEDYGDWLLGENPMGVQTEREVQNTALNLPIYRCLFVRNELPFDDSSSA